MWLQNLSSSWQQQQEQQQQQQQQQQVRRSPKQKECIRFNPKQHQRQQQKWLVRGFLGLGSLFFLILSWNLSGRDLLLRNPMKRKKIHRMDGGGPVGYRLAILLPYIVVGNDEKKDEENELTYWNLFCRGARASSNVADFFIIHNGLKVPEKHAWCHDSPNIIWLNLQSTLAMADRLLRVLDHRDPDTWRIPKETLQHILAAQLEKAPYTLVEYKPAYGHIFRDLLVEGGYTHWAYSDLDILFGDLGRHIEESEWKDFDIVTWGFGDQFRLYVKGQFTMHKISVLDLWKPCHYLSSLDHRYEKIHQGHEKYHFESAEGCYPAVLLQNHNISIKFGVKAWTDVQTTDTVYSHGLYLFQNPKHFHKHVLAKALPHDTLDHDDDDDDRLLHLDQDWFLKDLVYRNHKQPLQIPYGAMQPLKLPESAADQPNHNNEKKCMFWVQEKYQKHLCLKQEVVSESDNVYWVQGQLYKQAFRKTILPSKVDTGPFFHFQEWKRRFRTNQLIPLQDAAVAVLVPQGAIALAHASSKQQQQMQQPSHSLFSPLRISHLDWQDMPQNGNGSQFPIQKTYCLSGEPDHYQFHLECEQAVSWKQVHLVSTAPAWNPISAQADVTLVQTGQIVSDDAILVQTIVENLRRWLGQPGVVLLYVSPQVATVETIQNQFRNHAHDLDLGQTLVGILSGNVDDDDDDENSANFVSQKALQNMAMDVVPTRWFILGLDRGDILVSPDTVELARRKAWTYHDVPGNIFLIPTLAFVDEEWWNLEELFQAKENHQLYLYQDFDPCSSTRNKQMQNEDRPRNEEEKPIQDMDDVLKTATMLWMTETQELSRGSIASGKVKAETLSQHLQEMEYKLVSSLLKGNEEHGFLSPMSLSQSPLLLIDNYLGDSRGKKGSHHIQKITTTRSHSSSYLYHVLVRQVEEFDSPHCWNRLSLIQAVLLGFRLNVLEGAFAASTRTTRRPEETCRPCRNDELRQNIWKEEIIRPILARVLWDRQNP